MDKLLQSMNRRLGESNTVVLENPLNEEDRKRLESLGMTVVVKRGSITEDPIYYEPEPDY